MKINKKNVLLFIEPSKPAGKPVEDDLYRFIMKLFDNPISYGCVQSNGSYSKGTRYLGVHTRARMQGGV